MTEGSRLDRMTTALNRVKAWMQSHGAEMEVDNLASGVSPEALARFEAELSAGPDQAQNSFVGPFTALLEAQTVAMALFYLKRGDRDAWRQAGFAAPGVESNAWIPFASRNSKHVMLVEETGGRVFTCGAKDMPPGDRYLARERSLY